MRICNSNNAVLLRRQMPFFMTTGKSGDPDSLLRLLHEVIGQVGDTAFWSLDKADPAGGLFQTFGPIV